MIIVFCECVSVSGLDLFYSNLFLSSKKQIHTLETNKCIVDMLFPLPLAPFSAVILSTIAVQSLEGTVTLPSIDNSTLSIVWQPPLSPNGYITRYNIDVRNNKDDMLLYPFYNFMIGAVIGQQYYSLLVTNLSMSNTLCIR